MSSFDQIENELFSEKNFLIFSFQALFIYNDEI
jgi:hypothetical protein